MKLLESWSVGLDYFLGGHLNIIIGYLGTLVAGRYAKKYIARIKGLSEDKVFVFVNLSGGPSYIDSSRHGVWKALEKKWWHYGGIEIVPRYKSGFIVEDYDVKIGLVADIKDKGKTPAEILLKNIVKKLDSIPTIDIIAVYCPHFERVLDESIVCRACRFYAEHGEKCPYSKDLNIVFVEVKSTRSSGSYEITSSQKEIFNKLKALGYEIYFFVVRFKGTLQKPSAIIDIYQI